jgi:hypothetical protein
MSFIDIIKSDPLNTNCGVVGCWGKDELGRTTLNGKVIPDGGNANLPPHEGGGKQGGKLPDAVPPKYDINYTNTAIFGAIGGGIGYLVAKKLIKTDKVLIPILIGAAAFAYYQIDMSKKNR